MHENVANARSDQTHEGAPEKQAHEGFMHHLAVSIRDHIQDLTGRIHSRNKQFDIMRAFGILAILWGHNYQPPFIFFPVFYALPLFFFISGYFFKPQITLKDKFTYFLKKTRKQLLLYVAFNIFFGLLTVWLRIKGLNLGLDVNLTTLLISPFDRGDQFGLYLAAWFLFNLYFICIFAGLVFQKNHLLNIGICLCSIVMMCILLYFKTKNPGSMWDTFFSRSAFGFAFFGMGYLFHVYESKLQGFIVKPINVVILFVLFDLLRKNFGDVNYDILFGNVNNEVVIIPILATLCIIFMLYIIAFHLKSVLSQHSFVYLIGQHSFSIMVWHLTCFLLINFILYKLSLVRFENLSNVFFSYNIDRLWLLYQIPAIVFPILLIEFYYFLKRKCLALLKIPPNQKLVLAVEPVPAQQAGNDMITT